MPSLPGADCVRLRDAHGCPAKLGYAMLVGSAGFSARGGRT